MMIRDDDDEEAQPSEYLAIDADSDEASQCTSNEEASIPASSGDDDDDDDDDDDEDDEDDDGDEEWTVPCQREVRQARIAEKQAKTVCSFGIRCKHAAQCTFGHTDFEKHLFNSFPSRNFALWKTALCDRTCGRASAHCSYAHSLDELYCTQCKTHGHGYQECQYQRASSTSPKTQRHAYTSA
jgi:hypothetical protein